jgi:stage V sporulation protein SpoVS
MAYSDDFSENTIRELRVSGGTPPKDLAGSIIHLLQDDKRVRLAAIGHHAVGQAIKAVPIVNGFCITQGYIVAVVPFFELKQVPVREGAEEGADAQSRLQDRTVTMLTLIRVSPQ